MKLIAGRYAIENSEDDLIGRGGMGDVYRGRDTETGQVVAIKALKPSVVAGHPDMVTRFVQEGEALRRLNHPNIVQMVAAVEEGEQHYLVMEYVGGGSLQTVLEQAKRLPLERVVAIALELADALTRAHHLHIIHRDLKPGNVLLAAGEAEKGVEIYRLVTRYPYIGESPFFERIAGRFVAAAKEGLPAEIVAAAEERGRQGEVGEMVAAVLRWLEQ
jgi:hypothetical protein